MKGVSALLASVLLIAFTVSIAIIVFSFYSSTISSSTDTIGNKTSTVTECSSASINIDAVYVSVSTSTARAIVKNNGFTDLSIVSAQLINSSGYNFTASGLPLASFGKGSIASLTFSNVSIASCPGGLSKVIVTTTCMSDTFDATPSCV